uniref:F-box associated domain-containing protein n=1 Tax=Davidia involucrata TaxID=16924 RepID=A0A5B6ZJ93_DAVIN
MEERATEQRVDEMEDQTILEQVKNMKLDDEGDGEADSGGGGEFHEVRNPNPSQSLLGFYYNMNYDRIQFAPIPSVASSSRVPPYSPEFLSGRCQHMYLKKALGDSVLAVLNSSNGLILLYFSTFLKRSYSRFIVRNPITRDSFQLPTPPHAVTPFFPQNGINNKKRFLVYGFAFEPYAAPHPNFTVVELTDVLLPIAGGGCRGGLMVNSYSSLHGIWKSRVHDYDHDDIAPWLGNEYMLSGPSTFHNGALHWLLEPSGVIAYDLRSETFSFWLTNIPGDMEHVNKFGFCKCTTDLVLRARNFQPKNSWCNCRYVGESRDRLIYARVTDHSVLSLWILIDYSGGAWSNSHRIFFGCKLGPSLYNGGVLAFDRKADVVFLKVKGEILSYNYTSKKLKKICKVNKCYVSDDDHNCVSCDGDGFIIPYEVPTTDPPSIPSGPIYGGDIPNINWTGEFYLDQPNANPIRLYYHCAVTQIARKLYPHLQLHGTKTTQLPFRTPVDLCVPVSKAAVMNATLRYCDLVRLEACLYGRMDGRPEPNVQKERMTAPIFSSNINSTQDSI